MVGTPRRARHNRLEEQPVAPAHQRRVPLEREILDRHDGAAAVAERNRVQEVGDVRPEPAEKPWQRPRHARDLRTGRERHGVDSVRDELGVTRHRDEPEIRCERRQLAQQVRHGRLIARPLPPEHVGVDKDHATSS